MVSADRKARLSSHRAPPTHLDDGAVTGTAVAIRRVSIVAGFGRGQLPVTADRGARTRLCRRRTLPPVLDLTERRASVPSDMVAVIALLATLENPVSALHLDGRRAVDTGVRAPLATVATLCSTRARLATPGTGRAAPDATTACRAPRHTSGAGSACRAASLTTVAAQVDADLAHTGQPGVAGVVPIATLTEPALAAQTAGTTSHDQRHGDGRRPSPHAHADDDTRRAGSRASRRLAAWNQPCYRGPMPP